MRIGLLVVVLAVLGVGAALLFWGAASPSGRAPGISSPSYVGGEACAECHAEQARLWTGSDHDLAMQGVDDTTVLGDFDDAIFDHFGVTTTFFRRDGAPWVRTDGPDGEPADFEIAYVFGHRPLQQYLVALPGGRMQALGVAWDSRTAEAGGQRWFHLYPDEPVPHDDELHWTAPSQNWNHMCAECHSTNLRKGYVVAEDRYETTYAEIDVSCEACHGPGSGHVAWATGGAAPADRSGGLVARLGDDEAFDWETDPESGLPRRNPPRTSRTELETCARCHSRRGAFSDDVLPGQPLLQTHRPALLEEDLYHPDGQILDEVYVYGSFLQSRMHRAGVTCSDCHDPHRLGLPASPDRVCAGCHAVERYATPDHHHHAAGSAGASCVECHMPARTYMGVDPRRDHSFRVPRPDLTEKIGTPNACGGCHADRDTGWAAAAARGWWGDERPSGRHFGEAIHAARRGRPGAMEALIDVATEDEVPGIARATAMVLLRDQPSPRTVEAMRAGLVDEDPLVRLAALGGLSFVEADQRRQWAASLLDDPLRLVRIEAARLLADVPDELWTDDQRTAFERELDELIAAEMHNADRPESRLNLGLLHLALGRSGPAEQQYIISLQLDPGFAPAAVNLADLYRMEGRDEEGEVILREALGASPEEPSLHHSLGLLLTRLDRDPEGRASLERAAQLAPGNARFGYVYAVALHADGRVRDALRHLDDVHRGHPGDREVLFFLIQLCEELEMKDRAIDYAERLVEQVPDDPEARALLDDLRQP